MDFLDSFADISCDSLRDRLYKLNKVYDYIVISQSWQIYDRKLVNKEIKSDKHTKWSPFLYQTIEYFADKVKKIVVIGPHLEVSGTESLSPTIFLSEDRYVAELDDLKVVNGAYLKGAYTFFQSFADGHEVTVLYPQLLWSSGAGYVLHDGNWSFFKDPYHISETSSDYLVRQIESSFK